MPPIFTQDPMPGSALQSNNMQRQRYPYNMLANRRTPFDYYGNLPPQLSRQRGLNYPFNLLGAYQQPAGPMESIPPEVYAPATASMYDQVMSYPEEYPDFIYQGLGSYPQPAGQVASMPSEQFGSNEPMESIAPPATQPTRPMPQVPASMYRPAASFSDAPTDQELEPPPNLISVRDEFSRAVNAASNFGRGLRPVIDASRQALNEQLRRYQARINTRAPEPQPTLLRSVGRGLAGLNRRGREILRQQAQARPQQPSAPQPSVQTTQDPRNFNSFLNYVASRAQNSGTPGPAAPGTTQQVPPSGSSATRAPVSREQDSSLATDAKNLASTAYNKAKPAIVGAYDTAGDLVNMTRDTYRDMYNDPDSAIQGAKDMARDYYNTYSQAASDTGDYIGTNAPKWVSSISSALNTGSNFARSLQDAWRDPEHYQRGGTYQDKLDHEAKQKAMPLKNYRQALGTETTPSFSTNSVPNSSNVDIPKNVTQTKVTVPKSEGSGFSIKSNKTVQG